MTNEDIIYHLNALILHFKANYEHQWNKNDIDVFECIVEKLSNSDENCISRAEAIKAIRNYNVTIEVGRAIGKSQLADIVDSINKVQEKMISELPSIQPKTEVLDKIRAEIEQEYNRLSATRADETLELGECLGLKMSLKIIDKYKSEGKK